MGITYVSLDDFCERFLDSLGKIKSGICKNLASRVSLEEQVQKIMRNWGGGVGGGDWRHSVLTFFHVTTHVWTRNKE